ncbi:hypothetical protein [Bacillus sp. REN3]|uniref:hypothetical protein n=1 Tax=Bacillus sp. REN3 TaxID=2802440 RepID=UPI001AEE7AA0|nr:hypothetical protein [Bacillus sp. REN3]
MFSNILLITSFVLFAGAVYNLLALKKRGMYPPKHLLRKRAGSLAAGALILLILGVIFR